MPKMLILESCVASNNPEHGPQHAAAGDIVSVSVSEADTLAKIGRALYTDKKDDPNKSGYHTADAELLKAAAAAKSASKTAD